MEISVDGLQPLANIGEILRRLGGAGMDGVVR
jgi:hypothetical protein